MDEHRGPVEWIDGMMFRLLLLKERLREVPDRTLVQCRIGRCKSIALGAQV